VAEEPTKPQRSINAVYQIASTRVALLQVHINQVQHWIRKKAKEDTEVVTTRELIAAMKGVKQHKGLVISAIVMVLGAAIFGAITTFLPLFMLTEGVGNPAIYALDHDRVKHL